MMTMAVNKIDQAPEYSYHLLRGALETFQKNIPELNDSQFEKAKHIADKTFALESIVLSTAEARDVVIPDSKLDAAGRRGRSGGALYGSPGVPAGPEK